MFLLIQGVRRILRSLARKRRSTLAAIAAIALGIGLSSTMWSVVDGVFLRGLPVPDGNRIVTIASQGGPGWPMPAQDFLSLRETQDVFEEVAAFRTLNAVVTQDGGGSKGLTATYVTGNLFQMLAVEPVLGRNFTVEDEDPGAPPVAILSHSTWAGQFGSDEGILGESIVLNREQMTVIGVMPAGFHFPIRQDVWAAIRWQGRTWSPSPAFVVAKLRPNTRPATTETPLTSWAASQDQIDPLEGPREIHVRGFVDLLTNDRVKQALWGMLAASFFVLLAACANAANLRLTDGLARQDELQLRQALGAQGGRLIRLLLAESILIVAAGSALGLVVAALLTRVADKHLAQGSTLFQQFWIEIHLDHRTFFFALGVAAVAMALSGLAPAMWTLSKINLETGNQRSTKRRSSRTGQLIVSLQVGVAFALILTTTLLTANAASLLQDQPNFVVDRLSQTMVNTYQVGDLGEGEGQLFWQGLIERLEADPGVDMATFLGQWLGSVGIHAGDAPMERGDVPSALTSRVLPGHFERIGLPLLTGRTLQNSDGMQASNPNTPRPVVVSRSLSQILSPNNAPALGASFRIEPSFGNDSGVEVQVVGVVEDENFLRGPDGRYENHIYSLATFGQTAGGWVLVRGRDRSSDVLAVVDESLQAMNPLIASQDHVTYDQLRATGTWLERRLSQLFLLFGACAAVLAGLGLFAVASLLAHARQKEFGIRVAVGALPRHIQGLVFKDCRWILVGGLLSGATLALVALRFLGRFLPDLTVVEPRGLSVAVAITLASLAVAAMGPARRAAATDPVASLRDGRG